MPGPVGAHTFGFVWQEDAEAALEGLGEAGFDTVQLMATPPHFDPWRDDAVRTSRLRAVLERHGQRLLALDLASSDINLASPAAEVVDFAVRSYECAILRAAELGATGICVGSGRRHALLDRANTQLLPSFTRAFGRIAEAARRAGLAVLLENHPQGLLADAPAIRRFLASFKGAEVRVIYDVANASAIGEDPVAGLRLLADEVDVVHLSDSPRGQWRHDPIGSGDVDFTAIVGELRGAAFDGAVVVEILCDRPLDALVAGRARLADLGWPA